MKTRLVFSVVVAVAAAVPSAAQQPSTGSSPGPYARVVIIAPKPGQDSAFEAGYQRHLGWHRSRQDPWTWLGWSFVLGPRLDRFMDGTFGHAAADFDHSVDPPGDGANNKVNVEPYADFLDHAVYERLDNLSRGTMLPDTSTFLVLETYAVTPGRGAAFEAAAAARRQLWPESSPAARFTWLRLRIGGQGPQYLLLRAAPSWAAAAALPDFFEEAEEGSRTTHLPEGVVQIKQSELLRYRPTMSYHPAVRPNDD